jgi:hypothetical protein
LVLLKSIDLAGAQTPVTSSTSCRQARPLLVGEIGVKGLNSDVEGLEENSRNPENNTV